jgi:hypothetical protein
MNSGGLPKIYMLNNIISTSNPNDSRMLDMVQNDNVGMFSYNWIGGGLTSNALSAYDDGTNIFNPGTFMWDTSIEQPDYFDYRKDKSVVGGGLDLSKPFIKNNNQALPGMTEVYASKSSIPLGIINR